MRTTEDPRFSVLRTALEETEKDLEEEKGKTKVCRAKLADLKAAALENLKQALQRNRAIYEAGIQWMRSNAPAVEAEIESERNEAKRLREKHEKVKSTVTKVKGTLEQKFPHLQVKKRKREKQTG